MTEPGYDDWRRRVEKELRGAPFESLVSTLPGGIAVQPLYHQRPWPGDADPNGVPGAAPFVRGARPAGEAGAWLRCSRIDAADPAAAKAALAEELRGGCDAVWLELDLPSRLGAATGEDTGSVVLGSGQVLAALLEDVDLERVTLMLDAGAASFLAATFALETLRLRDAEPVRARLFLGIDPIAGLAGDGALPEPLAKIEAGMAAFAARCAAGLPRSRAVAVSALPWHEAGATAVQELGWAAATLVHYLRRLEEGGLGPEDAAGQIVLRVAVGRDLFAGIAKLRALRRLWAKVLGACGVSGPPPPFVHAVSSDRALARRDAWTNLLRVTTEVFAAVAGGADAITASAHDRLLPSAEEPAGSRLGRRIARNTHHVLAEEAHLGRVADAAGGSYYLETLTAELARRGWDEMRRVEAAGGIAEHLRSGRLHEEAETAWQERRAALVAGTDPVLGVSVFPPAGEEAAAPADGDRRPRLSRRAEGMLAGGEHVGRLPRHRLAEPFEAEGVPPPAGGRGVAEES